MLYSCRKCGTPSDQPRCPRHRGGGGSHWSPNRDRRAQQHFRDQVLERDGWRCTFVENGERCTKTTDLRACHVKPLDDFAPGDPAAYHVDNGVTRCADHDRATDSRAR